MLVLNTPWKAEGVTQCLEKPLQMQTPTPNIGTSVEIISKKTSYPQKKGRQEGQLAYSMRVSKKKKNS